MSGYLPPPPRAVDWPRKAACQDKPHHWWFPEGGTNPARALAICEHDCQVREQCLEFALATKQEHGIWGGMTAEERRGQRPTRVFCRYCGNGFPWDANPSQFCSDECRREARLRNRQQSAARR